MHYFSTNGLAPLASFATAAATGQAPDGGLYFPESLPQHTWLQRSEWRGWTAAELALHVMQPYVGQSMPLQQLQAICADTVNFPFPLVPISPGIQSLELFHGPTLAFKDVGARFMSRCLAWYNRGSQQRITVLVATSGDTGGAVAHGFSGVEGVEVIILYPEGKVSPVQELQLTTCGPNVHALRMAGSFDDCQAIVKQAFTDAQLQQRYQLSSANSINVARWLPQQLYYFIAMQQWPPDAAPPVVVVPSGNFGNICAAMLARRTGLPLGHFVAACNANDTIPHYLASGTLREQTAVATLSNAMDVARPSNFVRILQLMQHQHAQLLDWLSAYSISDATTSETIARVYRQHGYLLDPHAAVGYAAAELYLQKHPADTAIVLETAHPVKFPEVVAAATGQPVPLPASVQHLFALPSQATPLPATYDAFLQWMLER